MAAKPIERYVKKQIADQGGWARILERLSSGETQLSILKDFINPKTGIPISPGFFNRLLHQDPERSAAVDAAYRAGASVMIDIGLEKVNAAAPERDAIQKARVQLDAYLRVAALRDRERFGDVKHEVNVQVNVADIHLESLRHRLVDASKPLAAALHQVLPLRQSEQILAVPAEGEGNGNGRVGMDTCPTDHKQLARDGKDRPLVLQEPPQEKR